MFLYKYALTYTYTVILIKNIIQKEGIDLVHKLLIQSLEVFEMSMDLGLFLFLIDQREGGKLCRYRLGSKFHIRCLNYVIQTHIKDNLQAPVLLLTFL